MGGDHKCPVCQATFTRPQHVARHMRSHTGDRPYRCQHCGDQFARSDLLSRHINKCHPNLKQTPADDPANGARTGSAATAGSNRRKGATSANRATTSKQACDQCVQSSLPCDGANPCSKCIQRKCRCTFVKFHRQTAPMGPGHSTVPPPGGGGGRLGPSSNLLSSHAYQLHPSAVPTVDGLLLGPPPGGHHHPSSHHHPPSSLLTGPQFTFPNPAGAMPGYDEHNNSNTANSGTDSNPILSPDTAAEFTARYRAQSELLNLRGLSDLPPDQQWWSEPDHRYFQPSSTQSASQDLYMPPSLHSISPQQRLQHLQQQDLLTGNYSAPGRTSVDYLPLSGSSSSSYGSNSTASSRRHSLISSSSSGHDRYPSDYDYDNNPYDYELNYGPRPGTAPGGVVSPITGRKRPPGSEFTLRPMTADRTRQQQEPLGHVFDGEGSRPATANSEGGSGIDLYSVPHHQLGGTGAGGAFSSAFGLMSLDDPTTENQPFFSDTNNKIAKAPSAAGLTPREAETRELREFWKQYMRTPLSGPGSGPFSSGQTPLAHPSQQQLPPLLPPPAGRARARVNSLPSVKTPTAKDRESYGFYPVQPPVNNAYAGSTNYQSIGAAASEVQRHHSLNHHHYNGDSHRRADSHQPPHHHQQHGSAGAATSGDVDLRSYEAAVLARKAPTMLKLPPGARSKAGINIGGHSVDGHHRQQQRPPSAASSAGGVTGVEQHSSSRSELANAFGAGGVAAVIDPRPAFKRMSSTTLEASADRHKRNKLKKSSLGAQDQHEDDEDDDDEDDGGGDDDDGDDEESILNHRERMNGFGPGSSIGGGWQQQQQFDLQRPPAVGSD